MSDENATALTRKTTVRELVGAFQAMEAVVRSSFAAMLEEEQKLNIVFASGEKLAHIRVYPCGCHHPHEFERPDPVIREMSRGAWKAIIERMELKRLLSVQRMTDLTREIDESRTLPAITEENVYAFVKKYAGSFEEMFDEALQEVFEWLRPHYSKLKTNKVIEVAPKVILENSVSRYPTGGLHLSSWTSQRMTALENVLTMLDGRGVATRDYYSDLELSLKQHGPAGKGETPFFAWKVYGNNNLHLRWKRLDLLKTFNERAGGKRLRPTAREL